MAPAERIGLLMSIRIEIQEQPERRRFFAEVEVGGMVARRQLVTTERVGGDILADVDAHMAAIREALVAMLPKPKVAQELPIIARGGPGLDGSVSYNPEWPAPTDDLGNPPKRRGRPPGSKNRSDALDALRSEAEATGVRVDGSWGEARLRQEIETAQAQSRKDRFTHYVEHGFDPNRGDAGAMPEPQE
jgi:hypothetical protein